MKIGIFDSGLGGLVIAKEIFKKLPRYDYVYLGDTARIPYGSRGQDEILKFTTRALRVLFSRGCKIVVIACNTSSAKALRKIQTDFLPRHFSDRKVLGVIVPTLESIPKSSKKIGVVATSSTCRSHAYKKELAKINQAAVVYEQAAPQLVPYIENGDFNSAESKLRRYLKPLAKKNIDTLVLGCTHYPLLKKAAKQAFGKNILVISQEEIIPKKLSDYLKRHKEIKSALTRRNSREFTVTKITREFKKAASLLFGKNITLKYVRI